MKTCDALRRMIDMQNRIIACLRDARALVETEGPAAQGRLARRRWAMMRLLREYQLFKHVEIFDPAIASGDRQQADRARQMKARCIEAGDAFTAHVERWSSTAIAQRWEAYEAAMLAITADVRAHVDRERREVERLLRGSTDTRRPPSPVTG